MKKFIKFIFVFICFFIVNCSYVYAVEINMNINNSVENSVSIGNSTINSVPENTVISSPDNTVPSINDSIQKTSTTSQVEDFTLTTSDIINIILISVGIVLILLSVAILLKLK